MGMKILLTGGAGFIGSCVLRMLNDSGIYDVIVVDNIDSTEKWHNLVNKRYLQYIHKNNISSVLAELAGITHLIHVGACSSTTEHDFDYLYNNNVEYSKLLYKCCVDNNIKFIYASSAATYGDGKQGFDDETDILKLRPLNAYGYSKQLFDVWAQAQTDKPPQCVGLKFFNVYGPNEYCKGSMASVIYHGFKQVKEIGKLNLFKSCNPQYTDGGQLRDFVYVKDICKVIKFFLEQPKLSGLFNVGTGKAESFETLGKAVFKALNIPENIEYIDMPEHLKDKYQYFTEATLSKLRSAGYTEPFYALTGGAIDYIRNYLNKGFEVY
jgi:ADP-L-glycero-D-manno-heptose 6-epimerase